MASDLSVPVDFSPRVRNVHNHGFTGKGMLTIREAEQGVTFVFSGWERRSFAFDRRQELSLRADQILNVVAEGRCIQFSTTLGKKGRSRKPFVFCCPTREAAHEVAERFPKIKDADFVAIEDFTQRLHGLPGAASAWTSVTNLLIGANVVAFIAMGLLGAGWFEVASLEPYRLYGANSASLTTHGQWWRIVSCMFLHYGFIHLACNMWALFQTGHLLEQLLGRSLFALVYFGSGIVGSFVSLAWHGDRLSAGASGAVFGTFGALIGYMLREKHTLPRAVFQPLLKSTLVFTGYNLLFGLIVPIIDNAAHVGGLLGGIVLSWIVALPVDANVRVRLGRRRLALGALVVVIVVAVGVWIVPRRG